jgi:hypothetical protein
MAVRAILGENWNPQPEMQPVPTPAERRRRRVLAVARADGWSLVAVAGAGGLCSLLQRGWIETLAALLVVGAGAAELHGRRRLLAGEARGLAWLIRAQLALLGVIWLYAWWRWTHFDAAAFWAQLPGLAQAEVDRQLLAAGLDPASDRPLLLVLMNRLVCALLAFLTLLYQGGMALYYALQRRAVAEALLASPPPLS